MKRWPMFQGVLAALVTVLVACGGAMMEPVGGSGGGTAQAGGGTAAGGSAAAGGAAGGAQAGGMAQGGGAAQAGGAAGGGMMLAAMYPSWQLVDLQPQSPRANQSYGLAEFQGRPLVVYLIEGF
jgi:hypothetical protein